MFATTYSKSPLVSPAADELFPNIKGDSYRSDVSFLTVARALLYNRLPADKNAYIRYKEISGSAIRNLEIGSEEMIRSLYGENDVAEENRTLVVSVISTDNTMRDDLVKKWAPVKEFNGMSEDIQAEEKIFKNVNMAGDKCFIDEATSRSIVLVFSSFNMVKWHAIASIFPKFYGRYFEKKDGHFVLTEDEKKGIALGMTVEKKDEVFSNAILKFSEQFDFRTPTIRAALNGYESSNFENRIRDLDKSIQDYISRIEECNNRYTQLLRQKREADDKRTLLVLQKDSVNNKDTLMEYFIANKNLYLADYNKDFIDFYVKTPLGNFNPELAEELIKNPHRSERADMYTNGDKKYTTEDRDLLFKALFVDQSIRVWLFGKFRFSRNNGSYPVEAHSSFDQPSEMRDCCPNPHLFYHSCMGDNKRYAIDRFMMGDYVGAMEQTIGAAASVNLNEGVTTSHWMKDLLSKKSGRFFELSDGRRMNIDEVMKYLKGAK